MSVYIIGAGVGDAKRLTLSAREKIENADVIIGPERIAKEYLGTQKQVYFEYAAEKIARLIGDTKDKNTAVLFSGDTSFYSGAKKLSEIYPDAEIEPGISCVSYFCAKTRESMDDVNIVSLHGRKCNIVSEVRRNKKTFALLGENPCGKLCEYGLGGAVVTVGENMSYPDEKIYTSRACELRDRVLPSLSVMFIKNSSADSGARFGISDDEFVTGISPMTKSAVRAVTMSKLEIKPNDVCYDIGAGTGTVSVEMALAAYRGTVYAVEKNKNALGTLKQNTVKFGTDNVEIIHGAAPAALHGLPDADKVFIGGSSGNLAEIIEKCGCPHVTVNAITLETLMGTLKTFERLGYEYEVVQINASAAKKIASYNMMTAQNPVFIITGKKEALS